MAPMALVLDSCGRLVYREGVTVTEGIDKAFTLLLDNLLALSYCQSHLIKIRLIVGLIHLVHDVRLSLLL